jgi:glycosyltransferase involved in cell wall biosynthesis
MTTTPVSAFSRDKLTHAEIREKPLVSAIIIFFNAEAFLAEAIESVLAQTYDEWELLLVDDGSTDRSAAIADEYAGRLPGKVRYLTHPDGLNHGKPAARNLGIHNASGEYVAFLDADDVWLPEKLEQQVAILEAQPEAAMVYGLTQWWYSWTGEPQDSQRDFLHRLGVPANTLLEQPLMLLPFFLKQEAAIPCPSNILVRRKVIEDIGGFEEDFTGINNIYEDQAFYAKLALHAPMVGVEACWDRYRQHVGSSSAVAEKAGQEVEARRFFLNWLASYLSAQGFHDPETMRQLHRELWRLRHPGIQRFSRWMRQAFPQVKALPGRAAWRLLPAPVFHWLWARWYGRLYTPPPGWARFGDLRRLAPLSRDFGYDRGQPIDRYYIEKFLSSHQADISGHVLEIADDTYTRRFGEQRVTKSDILHAPPGNPSATIVGDLTSAENLPADTFDCLILTQTLQVIYDVPAALRNVYRILKPGGVALVTVPGISPVSRYDRERWGYYWSFTSQSAGKLFAEVFPPDRVTIQAHGNVLAAAAFLFGLATQELTREELDFHDPDYELVITIRAEKPLPPA